MIRNLVKINKFFVQIRGGGENEAEVVFWWVIIANENLASGSR